MLAMRTARGFSLVELLVAMSIAAILVTLAGPSFLDFLQNTQIRNAAESVANGLRSAQTTAIRRNTNIEFVVATGTGWRIRDVVADEDVETYEWKAGAPNASVDVQPALATTVTFNGLGRIESKNADGTDPLTEVNITNSVAGNPHPLRIVTSVAGIKMCDPGLPATDTKACP